MKLSEMKVGKKVKGFPFNLTVHTGVIKKVLKTGVHIDFAYIGVIVYDKAHCQFLKKVGKW